MKKVTLIIQLLVVVLFFSSFYDKKEASYPLTIKVKDLRNSKGLVQYALYNKDGTIPDEHYEKNFRKLTSKIVNGNSEVTFDNLPAGKYAVSILHDEDSDGKIKKGLFLPKEGIGFSNYHSITPFNKPDFEKASFILSSKKELDVDIIYL